MRLNFHVEQLVVKRTNFPVAQQHAGQLTGLGGLLDFWGLVAGRPGPLLIILSKTVKKSNARTVTTKLRERPDRRKATRTFKAYILPLSNSIATFLSLSA